jgi:hypothetical protein
LLQQLLRPSKSARTVCSVNITGLYTDFHLENVAMKATNPNHSACCKLYDNVCVSRKGNNIDLSKNIINKLAYLCVGYICVIRQFLDMTTICLCQSIIDPNMESPVASSVHSSTLEQAGTKSDHLKHTPSDETDVGMYANACNLSMPSIIVLVIWHSIHSNINLIKLLVRIAVISKRRYKDLTTVSNEFIKESYDHQSRNQMEK